MTAGASLIQWLSRHLPPMLALAVGLGLTAITSAHFRALETAEIQRDFRATTDHVHGAIHRYFNEHLHGVAGIAALLNANPGLTEGQFKVFARSLRTLHPHIQAFEWAPRVGTEDARDFTARMARAQPGYELRSMGDPAPDGTRFPVAYVEAVSGERQALGLDLASEPLRRATLEAARDSGRITLSPRLSLRQIHPHQDGLLAVAPVYRHGTIPATVAARRDALKGYAVAVLRLGDLLGQELSDLVSAPMDLHIEDRTPGQPARFLFHQVARNGRFHDFEDLAHAARMQGLTRSLRAESSLRVDGRVWALTLIAAPDVYRAGGRDALLAWLFGGSASLGLAAYLALLGNRRRLLRENEARFRAIFDQAAVGLAQVAPDGRWLKVNDKLCDIVGYSRQALLAMTFQDITHPDDLEADLGQVRRMLAGEIHTYSMEKRYFHKDGRLIWVRLTVSLAWRDERPDYFIAVVEDISGLREATLALRRERDLNQRYLDTVQTLMVALDQEGRITMINRKGCELLGVAETDLIGRNWFATCLPQPEGMEQVYPVFLEIMAGKREAGEYFENTVLARDGTPRLIAWRNAYLHDEAGGVVGTLSSGEDITERRQAEDRLRLAAAVFEHSAEGVMITDADRNMVSVNPAFTAITGYAESEVLGRNPRMLQSGRHDHAFYRSMWERIRSGGVWKGEIWNRRKDGASYPQLLTINAVEDAQGQATHYVGVLTDISDLRHAQEELDFLAHHDPLTALPNRQLFNELLGHAIRRAERQAGRFAVLHLGLDRFKNINDSLGHPAGDRLLVEVGQRLRQALRGVDSISRLGGDEFMLLLDRVDTAQEMGHAAERLIELLGQPFSLDGSTVYLSVSVGIALYPDDAQDATSLLRDADTALNQAKVEGGGTFRFFAQELTEAAKARMALETLLRQALEGHELELHYQPQVDAASGELQGVEALARWNHPSLGMISPARFIPLAEETGLIVPLGTWALGESCAQMRRWLEAGTAPDYVAVNVSAAQLSRGSLVEAVNHALAASGIEPRRLELEITESFIMADPEGAIAILRDLKQRGVRLAIDDFGTGYSSLAYLKHLPVDRLKVDQGFVRGMLEDASDAAIVKAVVALGHSLGLKVLAEGVETEEQLTALRSLHCDQVQGYLFSRPQPASAWPPG